MTRRAFDALGELGERYAVPLLDVLLIAANAEGASSALAYPRVRTQLEPRGDAELWQVILPLGNPESPFVLDDASLRLEGEQVAAVAALENDDVVLSYVRGGGKALTLNSYARSTCTGCLFCPNVIEDAADAKVTGVRPLLDLLRWVEADNGWADLTHLEVITVCSGCFHHPEAAISHLSDLRRAAAHRGFTGRLHLLSSVVRERDHLAQLAGAAGPFHLTLTIECFTRRSLLLKDSKASLTLEESCRILDDCADLGMIGDFTYVAGLDPLRDALAGLLLLAGHASTFPRIQVYQAHNDYMRQARSGEAATLDYHLRLRNEVEGAYAERGLAPRSWENYRPLWYSSFAGGSVLGPRV